MRDAAELLTDDQKSVQVSVPSNEPKSMIATFTIPKAGEMNVIGKIMRKFAKFMENYEDQTVWF